MRDALNIVKRNNLCTGCGACADLVLPRKIEIALNTEGYLRPIQFSALTKKESLSIFSACPGLNVKHQGGTKGHDPIWGPVRSTSIARAHDLEIHSKGSSGGVLTAIQLYLLDAGLVDKVISIRASSEDPFDTAINVSRNREELIGSTGSRYAPSAPLKNLTEILELPGRFAFVGKPCDVAALRHLQENDGRIKEKIPYVLSFMCAGVPSKRGSLEIIKKLGGRSEEVVKFRYRGDGWPGFAKAQMRNGPDLSMSYEDSWKNVLSPHVQWRCRFCPDGTGEFADLVCADAWHLGSDGNPDFSEHEGQSFVLARTLVGSQILEKAISLGHVNLIETANLKRVESVQFHQAYRRKTLLVRLIALRIAGLRGPSANLEILWKAALQVSPFVLMRAFAGTLKRALLQKKKLAKCKS